jgi:hypothetical protein
MINTEEIRPMTPQRTYKPILNHRTVLIVSRHEDRIKTISRQLYQEEFYCLKEYNCGQAIETLNVLNVAVILIDIDIPLEESRFLIEWLEDNRPEVHVFLINASDLCYELHHPDRVSPAPVSFSSRRLSEALRPLQNPSEEFENS